MKNPYLRHETLTPAEECERDAREEYAALPRACARCSCEFLTVEEAEAAIDGHCPDCAQLLAEREALAQHMRELYSDVGNARAILGTCGQPTTESERIAADRLLERALSRAMTLEIGLLTTGAAA